MSKSANFPYDILMDGKSIISDKDCDGKMRSIELMMDPDYNKEAFCISDTLSCHLLKCYDRADSYYWNCCAGSYFCDDSYL